MTRVTILLGPRSTILRARQLGHDLSHSLRCSTRSNWKGSAQAVFLGSNPYRASRNPGVNYSPDIREFTFVIKEQNDNRFSGESTDGKRTEKLIGGISPDNKFGIVLDDDGQYVFTVRDNDTL